MICLLLLLFAVALQAQSPTDSTKVPAEQYIKPVTVCEVLADPTAFDGKLVALLGAYMTGPESSYMTEDCGRRFTVNGKQWGNDIWVRCCVRLVEKAEAFVVDDKIFDEKFLNLRRTTKLHFQDLNQNGKQPGTKWVVRETWAIIYGKIEADRPGYGHMGGSRVQIVGNTGLPVRLKEDGSPDTDQKLEGPAAITIVK